MHAYTCSSYVVTSNSDFSKNIRVVFRRDQVRGREECAFNYVMAYCVIEKQSCGRCLACKKHPELSSKFSPDSSRGNSSNFHIQSLTLCDFILQKKKKKSMVFAHQIIVKSYSFFHHFPPAEIRDPPGHFTQK